MNAQTRRPRASYANVVATLALVIAVAGGTAYAAGKIHYLIRSTKQIKPSVLRSLRGATGPAGAVGPAGPAGPDSGAAGGALGGSYPDPTLGDGVVGSAQINPAQVQTRVSGTCAGASALATVGQAGSVTCVPTLPTSYGIAAAPGDSPVTISSTDGSAETIVTSESVPAGNYVAFASTDLGFREAATDQSLAVTCNLTDFTGGDSVNAQEEGDASFGPSSTAGTVVMDPISMMLSFTSAGTTQLELTCYRSAFTNMSNDVADAENPEIETIATSSNTFTQN